MLDKENGKWIGSSSVPEPNDISEENTHLGPPEVEDCSSDHVPPKAESKTGTKKILLPELVSMWKYMLSKDFANQRLNLYTYLNRLLRNGRLSQIVGFRVLNEVINRDACTLAGVDFRKGDRKSFSAHVKIEMSLRSGSGTRSWTGYLICTCGFHDKGFTCLIEDLVEDPGAYAENTVRLNPFLVPYYSNKQMDLIAEKIWEKYGMPEALTDPKKRDARELAARMGLKIQYLQVYEHQNVNGILFFAESPLITGEDRIVYRDGEETHIKADKGETVIVPANTIVVNTNRVREEYPEYAIFHECIHYELHYMFFRLQQMGSNDVRQVKTVEIELKDGEHYSDPIYFMEKQADRGAYGLMMPVTHTRQLIEGELRNVNSYKNAGDRFEKVGFSLGRRLKLPHFRIRPRMLQLGYTAAKGALNYVAVDKKICPFAFDPEAWRESDISYVIDRGTVEKLCKQSRELDSLISEGRYIYADGHVVRNTPRFVKREYHKDLLTDEALSKVDDCCLRFVRQFIQLNVGQYVYGRMFYDPRYVERTLFYLDDLINKKQMDELDAKMEYTNNFPHTFVEAFDMLMRQNGDTRETIAPKLHTTERSLHDWLYDPERKITLDFVVGVALMWELPDWISTMLVKRAMILVSEYDRRQMALEHIRTVLWDRGIDEANKYLASRGLKALAI